MKKPIVVLCGLLALTGMIGCAPASRETKWYEDSMRVRTTDRLEDIALSLPIFESRDPRATLKSGGYSVTENTDQRWRLLGDGAQAPLLVERVSNQAEEPLIVRVTVGPSEEGEKSRFLMKRYPSGWERSEYKKL